jgi:hypothetical protein
VTGVEYQYQYQYEKEELVVVTYLVIDRVERAALDFDEDIVGSLEDGKWNVDKLEYVGITGSFESDSVHCCRNRRHVKKRDEDEGDEGEVRSKPKTRVPQLVK